MLLNEIKFACLDTETTGLSPEKGGKICEIAVSVSQGGRVVEEFSTLLNPQIPMSPEVIAIHGITNEMVKDAPTFADIMPTLLGVLDNAVIVAHNADFDVSFLRAEFASCGMRFPPYPVVDTLKLARKSGKFESNRLGLIAEELGISCQGWHRAMADTKMAEQIFYYFLTILGKEGVTTLEQLNRFQCKRWQDLIGHN
ncbi:MAG: PolC-type DNA polymerase III [Candidatus Avelusimicrobium sp.]|uniref:3'-5' exonuclease n=1 Tax=Candidatus Avelusimicrobium sp. TaxID=3048833 RepID=UPI003F0B972E